ncbi:glycosyltransferase [Vibrio crassostreae]|uniref:glycosyltransferase n=1 Tax=Vibrio crassostreae TaxID=246167 RepID=UPI001B3011B1|nr:glycosyltransferase [Vibrio crassostreae]
MNVLIDATNIRVGGGLQVAVSVISELLERDVDINFLFLVSPQVEKQLNDEVRCRVKVVDFSKRSILSLIKYRTLMKSIENRFQINLVFSIFGPTYWNPKSAKHLIGFANAWLVSPKSKAYDNYSSFNKIKEKIKNKILSHLLFNKNAHYVTESSSIADRFSRYFSCPRSKISVVPNALSQKFISGTRDDIFNLNDINHFKFLTISHNYPHKNLKIIPNVAKKLEEKGLKCVFIVTFPCNDYSLMSSDFKKYTINVGPVKSSECCSLYHNSDALFLPTLIECFTVSYLEAMVTNKPICTSDLDFAHEICKDSAFYFDPYNIDSVVSSCRKVIQDSHNGRKLININIARYNEFKDEFIDSKSRVDGYLEIIRNILR